MTNLESEFANWASAVGYYDFKYEQQVMMKMGFFSGVLIGFNTMSGCTEDESEDVCCDNLTKLYDEIHAKMAQCGRELKKVDF